jgi:copper chaperone
MERRTIAVSGMSCDGCERNVESALGNLAGVNRTEADHESDTVEVVVEDDVDDDEITAAIEQAGYEVTA